MNAPNKVKAATVEEALNELDRTRNIAQRLNACMAEVDYVQKSPKKDGMKYSYVSHDAVTARVRPILQAHGVVYYPRDLEVRQSGNRTEAIFTVRFENIDDRADYIDVATFGYGVDGQDKGPGKAMSYGVKYALLKVLGLETGDDPEAIQDERANYRPDNAPEKISPADYERIKELAPKAGKTLADLEAAYKVEGLLNLTAEQGRACIARLEELSKEPANA